jgi:hypothetical protein
VTSDPGFWATPLALLAALAFAGFARVVARARRRRVLAASLRPSLVGQAARVCIPIPHGGVGAISYVAGSRRTTMPARSEKLATLDVGTPVVVIEIERRVAVVLPVPDELKEIFR